MKQLLTYAFVAIALQLDPAPARSSSTDDIDPAMRSLGMEMQEAARDGDLPRLRGLIKRADVNPKNHASLALLSGNALFMLGEFEAALASHRLAFEDATAGAEARLEAAIDLMALRRFKEACDLFDKVPSKLIEGAAQLRILRVHLNLRCGHPETALPELKKLYKEGHTAAAHGLVSVFGQQNVFRRYRLYLEEKAKAKPGSLQVRRALAELFLCGDYADTYNPTKGAADAVAHLKQLGDRHPGDCTIAGRLATAQLLAVADSKGESFTPEDFKGARKSLDGLLEPQPRCAEAVEAGFLLSRLSHPGDHDARIALLTNGVNRFPEHATLGYLLVQEHDAMRDHKVDHATLESMIRRSPDDWFPYARLSFQLMGSPTGGDPLDPLRNGLAKMPDSLVLNYLSALLLLKDGKFKDAVEPASRLLAGLLETGNYHHNWDMGVALLDSALEGKAPPFSEWPTGEDAAAQFQSAADLASLGSGLTTAHGCFAPGSGPVAILPIWYKPGLVRAALADSMRTE